MGYRLPSRDVCAGRLRLHVCEGTPRPNSSPCDTKWQLVGSTPNTTGDHPRRLRLFRQVSHSRTGFARSPSNPANASREPSAYPDTLARRCFYIEGVQTRAHCCLCSTLDEFWDAMQKNDYVYLGVRPAGQPTSLPTPGRCHCRIPCRSGIQCLRGIPCTSRKGGAVVGPLCGACRSCVWTFPNIRYTHMPAIAGLARQTSTPRSFPVSFRQISGSCRKVL